MTPAAAPGALEQALTKTMWDQSYGTMANASWEEAQRIAKAIPDGQAAWNIETVRRKAAEIVAKHFAPALATATAEAASLRADNEKLKQEISDTRTELDALIQEVLKNG